MPADPKRHVVQALWERATLTISAAFFDTCLLHTFREINVRVHFLCLYCAAIWPMATAGAQETDPTGSPDKSTESTSVDAGNAAEADSLTDEDEDSESDRNNNADRGRSRGNRGSGYGSRFGSSRDSGGRGGFGDLNGSSERGGFGGRSGGFSIRGNLSGRPSSKPSEREKDDDDKTRSGGGGLRNETSSRHKSAASVLGALIMDAKERDEKRSGEASRGDLFGRLFGGVSDEERKSKFREIMKKRFDAKRRNDDDDRDVRSGPKVNWERMKKAFAERSSREESRGPSGRFMPGRGPADRSRSFRGGPPWMRSRGHFYGDNRTGRKHDRDNGARESDRHHKRRGGDRDVRRPGRSGHEKGRESFRAGHGRRRPSAGRDHDRRGRSDRAHRGKRGGGREPERSHRGSRRSSRGRHHRR